MRKRALTLGALWSHAPRRMRVLSCCFVAVAVACGPAQSSERRARLPPRSGEGPAAASRFPDASRAWDGPEYRAFIEALEPLAPNELPRAGSPVFERALNEENLASIRDPKRPFKARLGELTDALGAIRSTSERYFDAHTRGGGLDEEFLRVHAFHVVVVRLSWELIEESDRASTKSPTDDAWHAARAEVPRATAALLLQIPTILEHRELHEADNLGAFIDRARAPLVGLFRRISPGAQIELSERLRALAPAERDHKLRERIVALADALERPDVTIDASGLSFGKSKVAPMPKDGSRGFDASVKRSGPNDLYLVPLGAAASGKLGDPLMTIAIAPETSSRVLLEVLFTLGQHGAQAWMLCSPTNRRAQLRVLAPERERRADITILVTQSGISLKTRAGNLAPGCTGLGPGLTLPNLAGRYDGVELESCIERVSAEIGRPRLALAPHPGLTFAELLSLSAALPESPGDVPELALMIAR